MSRTLAIAAVCIAALAAAGAAADGTYTNPIIAEIGPADPCVLHFRGTYYLYPTGDGRGYHVYTSADLVHWRKGPIVFRTDERNAWAPDVSRDPNDGRFYLYYTVNHRIGVAVADDPNGPFRGRTRLVDGAIDAHLFRDDDDARYLYYVKQPGFRIHAQPMASPLKKAGRPVEVIRPTEPWEKHAVAVTEGPWMLKHKGTYYLLYSGSAAHTLDYAVGYATAKKPTGPFTKHAGNPIVKRGKRALGPGHGCVVTDAAGALWHVYHQQKDDSRRWNRFLCLDPLWFDGKGVLHGRATRGTPQPAPAGRRAKHGQR